MMEGMTLESTGVGLCFHSFSVHSEQENITDKLLVSARLASEHRHNKLSREAE